MNTASIRYLLTVLTGGDTRPLTSGRSFVNTASLSYQPSYQETAQYTTIIPNSRGSFDQADIYYPIQAATQGDRLPVALFLQGALVDRGDYANFANIVASYGFTVIVPDRLRTLSNPATGETFTDFFAETSQINDTLDFVRQENLNPTSPISGILDTEKLALLGHSFGGAVGLSAINDSCPFGLCENGFTRPQELLAGVFFGTNLRNQATGEYIPIDNDRIPVALIQGDLDGVTIPLGAINTYESIRDPIKALITLEGANHYGITNEDSLRDPIRPSLQQDIATETIARWSATFLLANISQDPHAIDYRYSFADALDPNVTVISQTQSFLEASIPTIW